MLRYPLQHLPRPAAVRLVLSLVASLLGTAIEAAEIQLKPKAAVVGNLIVLSDVATIFENDAQLPSRLEALELGPAPLGEQQITYSVLDIQRTLLHRGADLSRHRFTGAARVVVASATAAATETLSASSNRATSRSQPILNSTTLREAEEKLKTAIQTFLTSNVSESHVWHVSLRCNEDVLKLAAQCDNCRVSGQAIAPKVAAAQSSYDAPAGPISHRPDAATNWLGIQTFQVLFINATEEFSSPVTVLVSQTPSVVILTSAVSKGTILQREHLRLQRGTQAASGDAFHNIEDVIGQESTQNMAPGQILDTGLVRAPELVLRGEIVSVIVHSSGVRLRMEGRAKETGRKGDMVLVESLTDRSVFTARVRALQTVEVLARSTSLEKSPASGVSQHGWVH